MFTLGFCGRKVWPQSLLVALLAFPCLALAHPLFLGVVVQEAPAPKQEQSHSPDQKHDSGQTRASGASTPLVGKGSLSDPGPPVTSSSWSATGIVGFLIVFSLSSLLGAMRVGEKFRQSAGLGVFSSFYTWAFVAFTALLSGISYIGLGELEAGLASLGKHFSPGFMSALAIGGGSGAGHIMLAIGRLLPRQQLAPSSSPQPRELRVAPSSNVILAFFHNGIYNHLSERFQLRTERIAQEHDWPAIRTATMRLIQAEIAIGRLTEEEGNKVISQIASLAPAASPEQDNDNRYQALSWAIGKSSFSQVRARLLSARLDSNS